MLIIKQHCLACKSLQKLHSKMYFYFAFRQNILMFNTKEFYDVKFFYVFGAVVWEKQHSYSIEF